MWLNLQVYLLFTYSVIFHQLVRRVLMLHVGHVTRFLHLTCLCRSRIIQSWSESSVCCCCCDPQKVPHLYDELRLRPVRICSRAPQMNRTFSGRVAFCSELLVCSVGVSCLYFSLKLAESHAKSSACTSVGGPAETLEGFPASGLVAGGSQPTPSPPNQSQRIKHLVSDTGFLLIKVQYVGLSVFNM